MGKCSGRCTLVAFCCLQLVSASLPGGRGRVGRGGAGSPGVRWVLCLCVSAESARVGGGLESRSGRAEPAPAGRAVSLCALLARRSPSGSAPCARVPPAPRPGFHASGLLLRGAPWDCGWRCDPGWFVDPLFSLPCVFLDHSFVCLGLPASGLLPLVSAP